MFGFVLVTVSETTFLLLDTLLDFTLTVSVSLGELADLAGLLALVGLVDFEALSISAVKFSSNSSGIGRIGLSSVLPLHSMYDLIVTGF